MLARSLYQPDWVSSLCQHCEVPDVQWQGWCSAAGAVPADVVAGLVTAGAVLSPSYRQAQAAVLEALPRLHKLQVPTRRPDDYFAEMAKSDQQMQKIRQKLKTKQEAMERSEKAKQLRAMRKYGKKVQVEILQRRQKEKKNMLNAVKKYQKGLSDKLDFLDEEQTSSQGNKKGSASQRTKKGPNAKRRYKNQKFGFGGKKKGSKWNTKESFNDVSSFQSKVAHNKGPGRGGKGGKGGKKALNVSKMLHESDPGWLGSQAMSGRKR
uniref:EBNA1 binding protein 2 n=1 Tax=Cyanistes caeruleus TaxID=156563 RepID=A0A8C0V231_CYACU